MQTIDNVSDVVLSYFKGYSPTGSYYICTPPVENTDRDFIVLVESYRYNAVLWSILSGESWELGGSEISPAEYKLISGEYGFASWKKGNVNLIITTSEDFYNKFVHATEIAKKQNLLNKEDRVALFQKILYGNSIPLWQVIKNYFSP